MRKKLLSLLLSAVMVFACLPLTAFAGAAHSWDREVKTHCGGKCGYSPVIVVPGIMQSQTYVQDKNGNDLMTDSR